MKYLIISILTLVLFSSCSHKWKTANFESSTFTFTNENLYPKDKDIETLISPYRTQVNEKMDVVIGMVTDPLEKRHLESTIGNWLTDLIKEEAELETGKKVDFAIHNYGGIRVSSLGTGPFLVGEAYEIMPFDNTLIIVKTHGDTIQMLMDRIARYGGWPVSKELKILIKDTIATEVYINGEALDKTKEYQFAVPDYVANGGDRCNFLIGTRRTTTDLYIREAIINHVIALSEKGGSISAQIEGRIKKANK